jgi:hypothetical protein
MILSLFLFSLAANAGDLFSWLGMDFRQTHVAPHRIRITAIVPKLEDIQRVRNCVVYPTCTETHEELIRSGDGFVYRLWVNLDDREVVRLYQTCSRDYLPFPITTEVKSKSKVYGPLPILPNNEPESQIRLQQQNFALYPRYSRQGYLDFRWAVNRLLAKGKNIEATSKAIKTYGLNTFDYSIEEGTIESSVSTTVSGRIRLANSSFKGFEGLMIHLRHELDHAQQKQRMWQCREKEPFRNSAMEHHAFREMSAHFNDILNLPIICNDNEDCIRKNRKNIQHELDRYLRDSPAFHFFSNGDLDSVDKNRN